MSPAIIYAIVGGLCIGLAAVLLYAGLGRIAGISGIFSTALRAPLQQSWATLFVIGLGLGGWLAWSLGLWDPGAAVASAQQARQSVSGNYQQHVGWLVVGGLLVGYGTRLGSGCTSGHGVCGSARLSIRSVTATITFVAVGMLMATAFHGVANQ
ncbi:MAG: YeeE/YedE family protein [Pseudomonadales bacterium]